MLGQIRTRSLGRSGRRPLECPRTQLCSQAGEAERRLITRHCASAYQRHSHAFLYVQAVAIGELTSQPDNLATQDATARPDKARMT
jgi:hypothetical protein